MIKRYKNKTLIILDWDDTLFPTTWAINSGIDIADLEAQNKYIVFFSKLDLMLYKLLSNLIQLGKVVIVTNAMTKWVKISSNILPNTQQILRKHIRVVSARDLFQKKHPGENYIWKQLVFNQLVKNFYKGRNYVKNIVSVGDAEYEFFALVNLYTGHDRRYLKSIRLMPSPSYDTLIDQLEVLNKSVNKLVKLNKHLDLKFSNHSTAQ